MDEEYKFPDEEDEKKASGPVKDEEVEIEVVDDTPEKDRGRKPLEKPVEDPSDEELTSYSDKVQARIKELTHARHDERREKERIAREKEELERAAAKLLEDNRRLRAYAEAGNKQVVESTRAAAEAELQQARRQYKEAQEAFDTDAIIAAQEALTEAKWRLEAAKNIRPPALQVAEDAVQTPQSDDASVRPDEKSLRWQAKNQWFGADGFEEVTSYALGLHQKLVKSGVNPRSDEYYDQLNGRLKEKFPEVFGEEDRQKPIGTSRKPTSVVAPTARSVGPRKIKLSVSQVNAAKRLGVTPQQYALEVAKLEAQNG